MTRHRHRPLGRAAALAPRGVPSLRVVIAAVLAVAALLVAELATHRVSADAVWVASVTVALVVAAAAGVATVIELEARRRAAAALARLGLAAASLGPVGETADEVVDALREVLRADRVVLVSRDDDGTFDVVLSEPPRTGDLPDALLRVVAETARPAVVHTDDPSEAARAWGGSRVPEGARGIAWIPAESPAGVVGLLGVTVRSPRRLTPDHDALLAAVGRMLGAYLDARARMARLETQANLDGLTGVLNRAALDRVLEGMFAGATRRGTPLCVAMLDLDHFKRFNDRNGHLAGDRLLKEVAAALQASVRRSDAVGRFGGEEFLLVFDGVSVDDALAALHRARTRLPPGITASAGVAALEPGDTPLTLVDRADRALYLAKDAGRNRVVVAPR
jgi:diguanylate cyclase (GGDEF)-like protein